MRVFLIMLAVLYCVGATMARSFVISSDTCSSSPSFQTAIADATASPDWGMGPEEGAEIAVAPVSEIALVESDTSWGVAISKTAGNIWRQATACPSKVIAFNQ